MITVLLAGDRVETELGVGSGLRQRDGFSNRCRNRLTQTAGGLAITA